MKLEEVSAVMVVPPMIRMGVEVGEKLGAGVGWLPARRGDDVGAFGVGGLPGGD